MIVDTDTGSYLLGVIHGDGHVSDRSISIAVSQQTKEYADLLCDLWLALGYSPHQYFNRSIIKVEIHSKALASELSKYKGVDRWTFPYLPSSPSDYIAGLIDTDGSVSSQESRRHRVNITQKSADKLPNIRPILDAIGFEHIAIETNHNHKIRGESYPIDVIWWNTQDDILKLASLVKLRHIYKADRLSHCVELIGQLRQENKAFHISRFLRETSGATIPEICQQFGFERDDVLRSLNYMRRQSRVTRDDPPVDTLIWHWVNTNKE